MKRYFIHLAYDGTCYHGWQVQPNGNTVQAELQKTLSTLLRTETEVVGAGRTDAGVHARLMIAHFDTEIDFETTQLADKMNRMLPRDIVVYCIQEVDSEMHARFSARARTYYYYIHTQKNPFVRNYSYETHYRLDFDAMNEAAVLLLEQKDFASFCKSKTDVKTTFCHVSRATWVKLSDSEWRFEITADRFLRNMVRAVVGTLMEVGRHRMTIEEFKSVVEQHNRRVAGESVPGHALFLVNIEY